MELSISQQNYCSLELVFIAIVDIVDLYADRCASLVGGDTISETIIKQ